MRTRATDGISIGRIIAAIIGATFALWLLQGDTGAQQRELFNAVMHVKHQETYDTRGVQFFEIRGAQGAALVSVDGKLELAKALRGVAGRKVRVVIEGVGLERVEREIRFGEAR